ncbi:hypothetical protein D1872_241150 [compost metagenome]
MVELPGKRRGHALLQFGILAAQGRNFQRNIMADHLSDPPGRRFVRYIKTGYSDAVLLLGLFVQTRYRAAVYRLRHFLRLYGQVGSNGVILQIQIHKMKTSFSSITCSLRE